VQVFSLRETGGHYRFFGFPPLPPLHPPHHERDAHLRDCATRFAANLESIVRRDPLQWYNFYPFWDEPASGGRERTRADGEPIIPASATPVRRRNGAGHTPARSTTAAPVQHR
jgi:hypothetical protein